MRCRPFASVWERKGRIDMLSFLMIGAHPDDMDLRCGGIATRLHERGHKVVFLSATNGNAGHMTMDRDALRERRLAEMAQAAVHYGGIRYETLDVDDGYLAADIPTRDKLIRYIRKEAPDVIITHRTNDYHPDHRACGQLVEDCAYLTGVPLICRDTPALRKQPVILYCEDRYNNPTPFRPDLCVPTDDVIGQKLKGVLAHRSQFYEWLPYDGHWEDVLDHTEEEATAALTIRELGRFHYTVTRFPGCFPPGTEYGEAFQISEQGGPMTDEIRRAMM